MNIPKTFLHVVALTAFFIFGGFAAQAQTRAFNYQGRLSDGSTAANGAYDLQFALFDAPTGGTQIGSTISKGAVNVANGAFSVALDFGSSPFTAGADRFLQIAVKKPSEANYTTLTPRQQLTASPYSIRTISAGAADSLSTNCVGCVTNAQIDSVAGSKITGAVPYASTANNANTATTAQFVSGIVGTGNGGTGSSTKNFVDLSTDQTVGGNKTFSGVLSGAGVTNLIKVFPLNGTVGTIPTTSGLIFVGETVVLTVNGSQRISGAVTAYLGKRNATYTNYTTAEIGICYQANSTGALIPLGLSSYADITGYRVPYAVTMSTFGFPQAGSYKVGYCVNNFNSPLDLNGYATGWVMVTSN